MMSTKPREQPDVTLCTALCCDNLATLPGHDVILGLPEPGTVLPDFARFLGADVGAVLPAQVAVAGRRVAHENPNLVTEQSVFG